MFINLYLVKHSNINFICIQHNIHYNLEYVYNFVVDSLQDVRPVVSKSARYYDKKNDHNKEFNKRSWEKFPSHQKTWGRKITLLKRKKRWKLEIELNLAPLQRKLNAHFKSCIFLQHFAWNICCSLINKHRTPDYFCDIILFIQWFYICLCLDRKAFW